MSFQTIASDSSNTQTRLPASKLEFFANSYPQPVWPAPTAAPIPKHSFAGAGAGAGVGAAPGTGAGAAAPTSRATVNNPPPQLPLTPPPTTTPGPPRQQPPKTPIPDPPSNPSLDQNQVHERPTRSKSERKSGGCVPMAPLLKSCRARSNTSPEQPEPLHRMPATEETTIEFIDQQDTASLLQPCLQKQHRQNQQQQQFSNAARDGTTERRCNSTSVKCASCSLTNPERASAAARRIVINVAGKRIETFEATLARFPNTLLGSTEKRLQYYDALSDEFFFDRSRSCIDAILYFYQSNGVIKRPLNVAYEVFLEELKFYELGREVLEKYRADEGIVVRKTVRPMPKYAWQQRIWLLFEYPESSWGARIAAVISLAVIIVSICTYCIETLPEFKHFQYNESTRTYQDEESVHTDVFFWVETICIVWFTFEFLMRFVTCPGKCVFFRSCMNIFDLLAILPYGIQLWTIADQSAAEKGSSHASNRAMTLTVLRVVRLFRVFRIFKLTRHSKGLQILGQAMKASARELGLLVFFLGIGVIIFSAAVYYVEYGDRRTMFSSIPDAFWYTRCEFYLFIRSL